MAVISKRSRGSVNDMLAAMKTALGEQSVEQSTSIEASELAEMSSDDIEGYLLDVEMFVRDNAENEVDSLDFSVDFDETFPESGSFIVTVVYNDHIIDLEVPFGDLTFNNVEEDGMYITNSIIESIEESLGHRDNE